MSTAVSAPRKISPYFLAALMIVLLFGLVSLYLGLNALFSDNPTVQQNSSLFLSTGLVLLAISTYWLYQTRRRMLRLATPEMQPLSSTLQCQKCGFKNVREFKRGDFVFKQTDEACPRDSDKMVISAIFREVKEKEKAKEMGYG